jgi:L-rhamnose mutarotase
MQHRSYLMRLKEEKMQAYADAHAAGKIWPSVVDGLKEAGITRMVIIQAGQDVILFEEAEDLDESYRYLASHGASVEWEKMIGSWMEEDPRAGPEAGQPVLHTLPVVFYLEDGRMRH